MKAEWQKYNDGLLLVRGTEMLAYVHPTPFGWDVALPASANGHFINCVAAQTEAERICNIPYQDT